MISQYSETSVNRTPSVPDIMVGAQYRGYLSIKG